tara:strand:+ start:276 stop:692 length:417 start_codon:yes stop_codon:yes gene_type:complete
MEFRMTDHGVRVRLEHEGRKLDEFIGWRPKEASITGLGRSKAAEIRKKAEEYLSHYWSLPVSERMILLMEESRREIRHVDDEFFQRMKTAVERNQADFYWVFSHQEKIEKTGDHHQKLIDMADLLLGPSFRMSLPHGD